MTLSLQSGITARGAIGVVAAAMGTRAVPAGASLVVFRTFFVCAMLLVLLFKGRYVSVLVVVCGAALSDGLWDIFSGGNLVTFRSSGLSQGSGFFRPCEMVLGGDGIYYGGSQYGP